MARRKNIKRIDPRYFLDETVERNDDGSVLEEVAGVHHYIAQGEGLKDINGDVLVKRGGSFAVQKGNEPGTIMVGRETRHWNRVLVRSPRRPARARQSSDGSRLSAASTTRPTLGMRNKK